MLDIKLILSDIENVKSKTVARNYVFDFDNLVKLDVSRKQLIKEIEGLQQQRNELSKETGVIKKSGGDASAIQLKVKAISAEFANYELQLKTIQSDLDSLLNEMPNLIDDTVPLGVDESSNLEIRLVGSIPVKKYAIKDHRELGVDLNLIDFERGVKISGTRFSVLNHYGAKLERALISFMLDTHSNSGYKEVAAPFLVTPKAMFGTGQLPKFAEEAFFCEKDNLYLIPTAEVSITNLYSDEILNLDKLPIKHASFSACFRREVGSYGKDVKGLIRQHQFSKVELVKITTAEESEFEHEKLLLDAEYILQLLELPYRVVLLSSGDIGFASSKTYDIEVWLPSENSYREISSCSNFRDFQSRRASIRYRDKSGKVQFAHTINGSGLAIGRTVVAILENYQEEDGSVTIPKVLRPYMNNLEKFEIIAT